MTDKPLPAEVTTIPTRSEDATPMSGSGGMLTFRPDNMESAIRYAELMAMSDIAVPAHLRKNPGACMAISQFAWRIQMDPYAVASQSYAVTNKAGERSLAYMAQLVAAVVNTNAPVKQRPDIQWTGSGSTLVCTVTAEFNDGKVAPYESPAFDSILPKNSPLWETDPRRQLGYYSIRAWARLHCPEVLLGVYSGDEMQDAEPLRESIRDITPDGQTFVDRLVEAKKDAAGKPTAFTGFDPAEVQKEITDVSPEPDDPLGDFRAMLDKCETEAELDIKIAAFTIDNAHRVAAKKLVAQRRIELPNEAPGESVVGD